MAKANDSKRDRKKNKILGGEDEMNAALRTRGQQEESSKNGADVVVSQEHAGGDAARDYEKTLRAHANASTLDHAPGSVTLDHLEKNIRTLLQGLRQGDKQAELDEPMVIRGDLTVEGAATFNSSVDVSGSLSTGTPVNIGSPSDTSGALNVSGDQTLSGEARVYNGIFVEGSTYHDYNGIMASTSNNGHLMLDSDGGNIYLNWHNNGGEIRIDGSLADFDCDISMNGNTIDFNDNNNDKGSQINSLGSLNVSDMSSNNGSNPINCTQSLDVDQSDSYAIRNYGGFYSSGYLNIYGSVINTNRMDYRDNNRPRDSWEVGADQSVRWSLLTISAVGEQQYYETSNTSW